MKLLMWMNINSGEIKLEFSILYIYKSTNVNETVRIGV